MHLINCYTRHLEEFFGEKIPVYAILSHTWGEGEVSYTEMKYDQTASRLKEGYRKIDLTCRQALLDGYQYAWVDTCCIDKSSSAELSEAINSMFRWYEESAVCYVYLSDVTQAGFMETFPRSRWFSRGWTLQELLAPEHVIFYDWRWIRLGTKIEFAGWLHRITKIDKEALTKDRYYERGPYLLADFCSAQKMSWASHRQTTREEDIAYSLLGIFNITMPLLYGEGTRAFERLQEEIVRQSGDDTILAWGLDIRDYPQDSLWSKHISSLAETFPKTESVLAASPAAFRNCHRLRKSHPTKMVLTNLGLEIKVPLLELPMNMESTAWLAVLSCGLDESNDFVGIMLMKFANEDRAYRPISFEHGTHTSMIDARHAAKATVQDIIIERSRRSFKSYIISMTHILLFPADDFVHNGFSISNAGFMHTIRGMSGDMLSCDLEILWQPDKDEIIVKNAVSKAFDQHQYCIRLWVTQSEEPRQPSHSITLCATCGRYIVERWHRTSPDDVQSYDDAAEEIHNVDSTNDPAEDCVFYLTMTKTDIGLRQIISLDIDLGNLPVDPENEP